MDIEANKIGGDFIAPDASLPAKKFILAARTMMYAAQDGELIKRAIIGADSLVDGSVPMIAMVMGLVEQKLGQLSPQDEEVVATHLAGTIVEIARDQGDPEAEIEDGRMAVDEIAQGVLEVLAGEEEGMAMEDEAMAMDPAMQPPEQMPPQEMQLMGARNG